MEEGDEGYSNPHIYCNELNNRNLRFPKLTVTIFIESLTLL